MLKCKKKVGEILFFNLLHLRGGSDIMGAGGIPNRTIEVINGNRGDLPASEFR